MALLGGREARDSWTDLLPGFIISGIGVGMVNPVLANVALSTVPEEHSGVASGINDTFRQVGVATGVAALGALFVAQIADRIAELLPGTTGAQADELAEAVSSGALPPDAPAPVLAAAQEGFLSGLNEILILGAVLAFVGAALTLLLVRAGDLRESEPLAEPAA